MRTFDSQSKAQLRQFLVRNFNFSELKILAADVEVTYDELSYTTEEEFCLELILYLERRNRLGCLIDQVLARRNSPEVVQMRVRAGSCPVRKALQLILDGIRIDKPEILAEIARLVGISIDDISILAQQPGSIRLLISLPADAADRLVVSGVRKLGKHQVLSITPFVVLGIEEQMRWRRIIQEQWASLPNIVSDSGYPLEANGPVDPRILRPPKPNVGILGRLIRVLLGVLVVSGAIVGVGALVLPIVRFENNCHSSVDLDREIPIIGKSISENGEELRVLPGNYTLTKTRASLSLTGPLIDVQDFRPNVPFNVVVNNNLVDPSGPVERSLDPGSRVKIVLCP